MTVEGGRRLSSIPSVAAFCGHTYSTFENQLSQCLLYPPSFGVGRDAFSIQRCVRAVLLIDDQTLKNYHIKRVGGDVHVKHKNDLVKHAYFSSIRDENLIIDFTFGQFAELFNTTLDNWIHRFPLLFNRRALCACKNDINEAFGLIYPPQNIDFWEYFNSH